MLGNIQLVLKVNNQEINIDISKYLSGSDSNGSNQELLDVDSNVLKDISLNELLNLYSKKRKIKDSTFEVYKLALTGCFKDLSLKLSQIFKLKISYSDSDFMKRVLILVFNFAVKQGIIVKNIFATQIEFNNKVVNHRKALNANDWRTIEMVKKDLNDFFSILNSECCINSNVQHRYIQDFNFKYFVLLHMILGTRISETIEVIKNFTRENELSKSITIKTKNTKKDFDADFCLPLTSVAIYLIKENKDLKNYTKSTLYTYIDRFFLKNFLGKISAHGTRAIFRTILDILPETKKFDFYIKEACLDHRILNKTQRSYQRYDYFSERYFIQKKYSNFLLSFFENENKLKAILNSDTYLDEVV